MHYSQTFTGSEGKFASWKPIKQSSYMNKLNSFAVEHSSSYQNSPAMNYNGQQAWSPNTILPQNNYSNQEINTWSSDKKSNFRDC